MDSTPNVIVTRNWPVAIEHSEIAIVLMSSGVTRDTLYPNLLRLIPDHYVVHKVLSTRFTSQTIVYLPSVPLVPKYEDITTAYGYMLPVAFLYAPSVDHLRVSFRKLNNLLFHTEYPHEFNDGVTIFSSSGDSHIRELTACVDLYLDVGTAWIVRP